MTSICGWLVFVILLLLKVWLKYAFSLIVLDAGRSIDESSWSYGLLCCVQGRIHSSSKGMTVSLHLQLEIKFRDIMRSLDRRMTILKLKLRRRKWESTSLYLKKNIFLKFLYSKEKEALKSYDRLKRHGIKMIYQSSENLTLFEFDFDWCLS